MTPECVVCGGEPPFRQVFSRGGFELVRCQGCGLVFQDPQPSDQVLDESYYHDPGFTGYLMGEGLTWTRDQAQRHLDFLIEQGVEPRGRLLDVGCSSGAFLDVAARRGWGVTGIELGESTAAAARTRGLDVRTGTLGDHFGDLGARAFSLVCFWDVLEHLRDPRRELEMCADLVEEGGYLALSCPNVDGLFPQVTFRLVARPFGVWEYPELPVHLYDFSPSTLSRLLDRHGFRTVAVSTYNSPWEWFASQTASPSALGGGRRGVILSRLLELLHTVVYPVSSRTDRGNGMFVLAQRR